MTDCIFCKIINGEIPSDKVYEDDKILAFNDVDPQSPTHILVIPKEHIESLNHLDENNIDIIKEIYIKIKEIAKEQGLSDRGYRVVTNCGKEGGQTVGHLHFHLLGGRNLQWPPG
ncbi:histidine triad nucleotide-binding protein [Clostridiisalibacter paucivorans]|uniref:histidine triad nucleotide-binding protein n=1 Tax=Clostridiisalibacter paucivorans TaxID=408753 RepID=UPI00047A05CE|nr:histidine triad nucleotide-binding protein [Clostridiisalibacter paucivorans]